MSGEQGVHIGLQPQLCIDGPLVKLDLNKAIWISANDEVHLSPIYHDHLLDVVHDIRELSLCDSLHAAVGLCRLELPMQYLILLDPLGAEDVFLAYLVGVIQAEEGRNKLFQCGIVEEAVLELD
jgi:hypothetical protein